jgi:hypothetical protein
MLREIDDTKTISPFRAETFSAVIVYYFFAELRQNSVLSQAASLEYY